MNNEEKGNLLKSEDHLATGTGSKLETTKLPESACQDTSPDGSIDTETPEAMEAIEQPVDADGSPSSSEEPVPRTDDSVPPIAVGPIFVKKHQSFLKSTHSL